MIIKKALFLLICYGYIGLVFDLQGQIFTKLAGDGNIIAGDMTFDNDGNIYLTGGFSETLNMQINDGDSNTLVSTDDNRADIFLASYSKDGNHRFSLAIGSDHYATEKGLKIDVDGNNNIYIIGIAGSNTDFDPGNSVANLSFNDFDTGYFLASYSSSGAFRFVKSLGSVNLDNTFSLASIGGTVYVSGVTTSSFYFDISSEPVIVDDSKAVNYIASFLPNNELGNFLLLEGNLGPIDLYAENSELLAACVYSGMLDLDFSNGQLSFPRAEPAAYLLLGLNANLQFMHQYTFEGLPRDLNPRISGNDKKEVVFSGRLKGASTINPDIINPTSFSEESNGSLFIGRSPQIGRPNDIVKLSTSARQATSSIDGIHIDNDSNIFFTASCNNNLDIIFNDSYTQVLKFDNSVKKYFVIGTIMNEMDSVLVDKFSVTVDFSISGFKYNSVNQICVFGGFRGSLTDLGNTDRRLDGLDDKNSAFLICKDLPPLTTNTNETQPYLPFDITNLYPNPTNGHLNFGIYTHKTMDVEIGFFNTLGEEFMHVFSGSINAFQERNFNVEIGQSAKSNRFAFLSVKSREGVLTRKVLFME